MGLTEILIIAAMLVLNGLFAAYELGLASVRPARLAILAEQRRRGARAALAMKQRMEGSLAVVQLGITLVGAIAAATGGANVEERLAPMIESSLGVREATADLLALAIFVIPLAAVTIVVGELVPKVFALNNPEPVVLVLSPAMRVFAVVVFPAVWCFEQLTRLALAAVTRLLPTRHDEGQQVGLNELRAQVSMLRASRLIGSHQERIIVQASRLSTVRVDQIMAPVEDVVTLWADGSLTDNIVAAHMDLHTRFPVAEIRGDPQSIVGYVNIKEMFFLAKTHPHNPSLREIIRPVISLRGDMSVSDALTQMVTAHVHLAMVRDDRAHIVGMVTQEDVFEELVGDIEDEFDRLPRHLVASGARQWVVGGGVTLGRLREAINRPAFASQHAAALTLHDLLALHRPVLHGGDVLEINGAGVLVRKVRRQKVAEVIIDPSGPITAPPAPAAHTHAR